MALVLKASLTKKNKKLTQQTFMIIHLLSLLASALSTYMHYVFNTLNNLRIDYIISTKTLNTKTYLI